MGATPTGKKAAPNQKILKTFRATIVGTLVGIALQVLMLIPEPPGCPTTLCSFTDVMLFLVLSPALIVTTWVNGPATLFLVLAISEFALLGLLVDYLHWNEARRTT